MGGMALGGHTGRKESYDAKQRREAEKYQQDLETLKQTQDSEKAHAILNNNEFSPSNEIFKTAFGIVIKNDPKTALYLIRKKIQILEKLIYNEKNRKRSSATGGYLVSLINTLRPLYEYEQQAMLAAGEKQISTKREEVSDRIKRLLEN